jgi:hypothetical protein
MDFFFEYPTNKQKNILSIEYYIYSRLELPGYARE